MYVHKIFSQPLFIGFYSIINKRTGYYLYLRKQLYFRDYFESKLFNFTIERKSQSSLATRFIKQSCTGKSTFLKKRERLGQREERPTIIQSAAYFFFQRQPGGALNQSLLLKTSIFTILPNNSALVPQTANSIVMQNALIKTLSSSHAYIVRNDTSNRVFSIYTFQYNRISAELSFSYN